MYSPVRSGRLYQQIGAQIVNLMQDGMLTPGQKLPPESELAGKFKVSRATVREALIALETVGYVEVRNGTGTYVRAQLPGSIAMPWNLEAEPEPGPFEQFQAREVIEPAVAAIAAAQITAEEIAELERIVGQMEDRYPRESNDDAGAAFHITLALSTRNLFLANSVRQLWAMREGPMWNVLRGRLLSQESRQHAIRVRQDILDALKRRDAEGASTAMKSLLGASKLRYFQGVEDDASDTRPRDKP